MSSLPGTLNFRIKFCHSTGIARSGAGGQGQNNKLPMLSEGSDPAKSALSTIRSKFIKKEKVFRIRYLTAVK